MKNLDLETKNKLEIETKKLLDTFRCYSLHCGGIVYYENGIPEDIIMENKEKIEISCRYLVPTFQQNFLLKLKVIFFNVALKFTM